MDARNWDQHNTSFLEIADGTIVPIGDKINAHVATVAGETFELVRAGKYIVVEGEVGDHRVRVGKLAPRTVTMNATTDLLTVTGHPYVTGDGPLRIEAAVKRVGSLGMDYDQIGAANDKMVRTNAAGPPGSWVTDGFAVSDVITISGSSLNNGVRTIAAISTTTGANDTLEFAGDVLVDELFSQGRVIKGTDPAGISAGVNYWVIKIDDNTIRLATSYNNAMNGVFVDITSAPSDAWLIGGNQGPTQLVGFAPVSPSVQTSEGESNKLLRQGEIIIVNASALTVRSLLVGDVLKWWNVG